MPAVIFSSLPRSERKLLFSDNLLEEFSILGFYDFPTRSAEETFSEIRAIAGECFDKIVNVDKFVSVTRRGEDYQ